ncbi:MAG TPA: ATP-binding cassette domain-containing protein [bacterium]|nr:ATP-binding cassette domain-containing protein [bacterium]HPJ71073.1 ATP-binding cassette domain-containing protein [bacterium]HPQ65853.1 ATP-binding cassette domain-containing protein [bacterium]
MAEVRDLVCRYGDRVVLNSISFDILSGEILCIIGGSGCGKTTLLRHLAGLLNPAAGTIRFWGENIVDMNEDERSAFSRRIGIAFQGGALFNSMTVGENIALPIEEHGIVDPSLVGIMVEMKLGLVGLGGLENTMPSELSGGMVKRVGFARSIATDPEVVFFDEPSAGLDPITSAGLDQLILKIRKLTGSTLVVVTHELNSIETIADRILMLDEGKIVFMGTPAEASRSREPRLRQFFEHRPDEGIEPHNR